VGFGISWLSRPFRGDHQAAVGIHVFSALDVSESGGTLFAEYYAGRLLLGAGATSAARSVKLFGGAGETLDKVNLCVLPFARAGLDLRAFERRLAAAVYAQAGPAFCQDERFTVDVVIGLRLSLKNDERGRP
jgi:hypothetical protein